MCFILRLTGCAWVKLFFLNIKGMMWINLWETLQICWWKTKSKKELIILVTICGRKSKIIVDVVNSNILLLISRLTMTNLGMLMDKKNHKMIFDGKAFKLDFRSNEPYVIPVYLWTFRKFDIVEQRRKKKKSHKSLMAICSCFEREADLLVEKWCLKNGW